MQTQAPLKNVSFSSALFNARCPHCREGALFSSSPFNLGHFRERHRNCQVCGVQFEKEPDFFLGAMYFLYALNVAVMVASGIFTLVFLHNPDAWVYVGVSVSAILTLFPMNYRFAHSLMIHLFGDYEYQADPALRNARGLVR